MLRSPTHRVLAFAVLIAGVQLCWGQLNTGNLKILVVNDRNEPQPGVSILVTGKPSSSLITIHSDSRGESELVLPYGEYRLSSGDSPQTNSGLLAVYVPPLQTVRARLVINQSAASDSGFAQEISADRPWSIRVEGQNYPGSYSINGLLLAMQPETVSAPLDFSGLASMRLFLLSARAYSWTDMRYTQRGMNAMDSYQPGRALAFPDVEALSDVVLRIGSDIGTSLAYGSEIGLFTSESGAAWHGLLSTSNTGGALASGNLPDLSTRGNLQQSEHFRWYTRDTLQVGGPIGRRADIFLSGTGQWASQTVPQVRSGPFLNSRLLFGNARGRLQLTGKDQLDMQFNGSRLDLSNWGNPVGIEALIGRRMAPSYDAHWGFPDLREEDHLDSIQIGWTRQLTGTERAGALQVRYAFSPAHLDTVPNIPASVQSRVDLSTDVVVGAAPIANLAIRTWQNIQAAFQPGTLNILGRRQRISVGGGWELANIRNRLSAPADLNLITADGTPAFVVQLNTPLNSRERLHTSSIYVRDNITVVPWLAVDLAVAGDFPRGSLPSQSSLAGNFAPARNLSAMPGRISWNNASPRAGVAIAPPMLKGLILRGSYARLYSPLAGRYLDFGNANSLGGSEYQWLDTNGDRIYQPGEAGQLLRKFGGPYSSIDPQLKRPYADEFNVAAELSLSSKFFTSLRLFRRDEKNRIAVTNVGVPSGAYQPVQIIDPGPDSIPGTFDDQLLTVYSQNPSTFGQDQYLLTNPKGLRMMNEGLVATAGGQWRSLKALASFMAVKSYGPTNPGNSVLENDPGVIGALFQDPNTAIQAAGRIYFDRAYVGKIQLAGRTPKRFGAIEWANTVEYLDGLVFARRLLVNELPQGPLLIDTTVRGSPEGGNRAEYVLNWNLRIGRTFQLPYGAIRFALDVLNVTNANNRLQENDLSSPTFNQRLPVVIETPRFIRFELRYQF
jgi:hypothetical protein